jgi:subfamily B ATP-binding cassette protein MsbA
MKKFSVILQYLSKYRGKIVVYMIFNVLSIVFGLLSVGMLSPYLAILFSDDNAGAQAPVLKSHAIGGLKEVLGGIMQHHDKSTVLVFICVVIVVGTILKNLFYYWSSLISSPIRSATITFL